MGHSGEIQRAGKASIDRIVVFDLVQPDRKCARETYILFGYGTMHSRYYNMNIFDGLRGAPRNTPDFRPILVLLSTRSKANP